jgi:predicted aspartyl protease
MSKIRVNRNDEEVRYPENRVVGVVNSVPQLERADKALLAGGFLESEIGVICGQPAADKLRANTGRTGMTNISMRVAEKLGMPDEETQIKNRYADSLEAGDFVVAVKVVTDERKEVATRLLKDNGGHSINFFGRFVIETMDTRKVLEGGKPSSR